MVSVSFAKWDFHRPISPKLFSCLIMIQKRLWHTSSTFHHESNTLQDKLDVIAFGLYVLHYTTSRLIIVVYKNLCLFMRFYYMMTRFLLSFCIEKVCRFPFITFTASQTALLVSMLLLI